MHELTRRSVLRLGAGLAGACALDPLWQLGLATASGAPPVDQPTPSSAKATHDLLHRLVRLGGPRRRRDQVGDRRAAGPLFATVAHRDRAARPRYGRRRRDGNGRRSRARPSWRRPAIRRSRWSAVDGGNGWWHRRADGEDSGSMVLNEFLPMLANKGLDTRRVSFIGWSMGGYGALLLGGALGAARTAAICAVRACVVHRLRLGHSRACVRRPRGLVRVLDLRHARAVGDPDTHRLRRQRPFLRRHQAVRRIAAQTAVRGVLRRRPRRRRMAARSCPESWPGWPRSALIPGYTWVP